MLCVWVFQDNLLSPDYCTQALMSGHGLFSKVVSSKCFVPHAECRHPESEACLSFDSASVVQDGIEISSVSD